MQRKLLKDFIFYGGSIFLVTGMSGLLTPLLTRWFSVEEIGLLDLLQTIALGGLALVSLQMESALLRYLNDKAIPTADLITTHLVLSGVFGILAAIVLTAAAPGIAGLLQTPDAAGLIILVAWALPLSLIVLHGLTVVRTQGRAGLAGSMAILNAGLYTAGVVVSLLVLRKGLAAVLWSKLIADAVTAACFLVLLRTHYRNMPSGGSAKRLLSFGIGMVPYNVTTQLMHHSGKWMLMQWASLSLVGVFAISHRLAIIISLFTLAIRMAWKPYAFSKLEEPETPEQHGTVLRWYGQAAVLGTLLLTLFAPECLALLGGPAYTSGAPLIGLLAVGFLYRELSVMINIGIEVSGQTWRYSIVALLSTAAYLLIVQWGLRQGWGLWALGWATFVSMAALLAGVAGQGRRFYPVRLPIKELVLLGLLAVGSAAAWSSGREWPLSIRIPAGLSVVGLYLFLTWRVSPSKLGRTQENQTSENPPAVRTAP